MTEGSQRYGKLKHYFFIEQWKLEATQFFLLISVLTTEERLIQDLTDAFLESMWNILYWSCYSTWIRSAKASRLTVFRLSNRSRILTLRYYKNQTKYGYVKYVNIDEAIAPQCSQRLVYSYIHEFRTSYGLNWICQSEPCNTHFAGEGVPALPFCRVWEPANTHSCFHLVYHVWWL